MQDMLILHSDATVVCPRCSHQFALVEGITRQTIDHYAEAYASTLRADRQELEQHLQQEAQRKAMTQAAGEIAKLQEQVAQAKRAERESAASLESALAEARAKVIAETEQQRKAMQEDLDAKDKALAAARQQELDLRRERQALQEQKANMQLEVQRKLDEDRRAIEEAVSKREAERHSLIEAELKKKIDDANQANDELRRKLNQGSQQLQGEVLELHVEQSLASGFAHDLIEEVKKGVRGADVIQTVRTPTGAIAGKIIWEAKRADNWSDKWLEKLQDDQQEAKADLAVLVTTAMPRGVEGPFARIGDVWVVSPRVLGPMAETLRVILLENHKLRIANTGKGEKMELVYSYLTGPVFSQRIRTMLEALRTMQQDLDAEKRAMTKIWAKRQAQIQRASHSMVTVVGDLQGIAQGSLAELDADGMLALPDSADEAL